MPKFRLRRNKLYRLKKAIYQKARGRHSTLYDLCDLYNLQVKHLVVCTGVILLLLLWLLSLYNKYTQNSYSSMQYEY